MEKHYTTYEEKVTVNRSDWERWMALLEIDDIGRLNKTQKKLEPKADDKILIGSAKFGDGAAVSLWLVSGNTNYYIDTELVLPDGTVVEEPAEPGYDLDVEMETTYEPANVSYNMVFTVTDG